MTTKLTPKFSLFPSGKRKCLTLSYDDSHADNRKLVKMLDKYKIKSTFHLNSNLFDSKEEDMLKANEIKDLFINHEVSAHSASHPFLERIPHMAAVNELLNDRKVLESLVDYPIRGMSYPFGTYNSRVIEMLPSVGVEYSRTVEATSTFIIPNNFLLWHPTCHHCSCLEHLKAFKTQHRPLTLFYMWGHAFEFARNEPNNSWEMIEEFCDKASGMDDVWYATNIEVMDYIKGLHNLKFSADCSMVYNPNALELWFELDNQEIKIKPGETLKF